MNNLKWTVFGMLAGAAIAGIVALDYGKKIGKTMRGDPRVYGVKTLYGCFELFPEDRLMVGCNSEAECRDACNLYEERDAR